MVVVKTSAVKVKHVAYANINQQCKQSGTKAIPPRERLGPDRFFLPPQLSKEQTLIEAARDSETDRSCLPPQLSKEQTLIESARDSESDRSCLPPQLLEEQTLIESASAKDSDTFPPHPRCFTCGIYLGEGCERQVCGRRGYCEGYGY